MKKLMTIFGVILLASVILISCGGGSNNELENKNTSVDLCKCLTEPGNSDWATENKDACDDAISKELGVENWANVNFSKEPELNQKWDLLVEQCTGSEQVKTGVKEIDRNSELVKEIGTSYGYVWESINTEAQIYTTLAFDGLIFRSTVYSMNGKTNSEDFIKIIDLSGKWNAIDNLSAGGVFEQNNVSTGWKFNEDYTNLTNNKGVVFQRVKVR